VSKPKKVTIQVNRQQYRLIKELREKGEHGQTDGEIVRKAFTEWGKKKRLARS
jgi:hypothetical protein